MRNPSEMVGGLDPGLPRRVQIEQILRQRIARDHRAGDRFASEPDLAAAFGVSRTMIRAVIARLAADGMLRQEARRGNFVASASAAPPSPPVDLDDALAAHDPCATIAVVALAVAPGPDAIRRRLGIAAPEPLVLIRHCVTVDGVPRSVTASYLPFDLGAGLSRADVQAAPIAQLIHARTGIACARIERSVAPILAEQDVARRLAVAIGAPILLLDQTYVGREGAPVFVAETFLPGGPYRLP